MSENLLPRFCSKIEIIFKQTWKSLQRLTLSQATPELSLKGQYWTTVIVCHISDNLVTMNWLADYNLWSLVWPNTGKVIWIREEPKYFPILLSRSSLSWFLRTLYQDRVFTRIKTLSSSQYNHKKDNRLEYQFCPDTSQDIELQLTVRGYSNSGIHTKLFDQSNFKILWSKLNIMRGPIEKSISSYYPHFLQINWWLNHFA